MEDDNIGDFRRLGENEVSVHDEAEIKALLFKWIRSSEPYAESVGQTLVE